jgi:osmotically-inducible protein OsmY
MTDDVPQYVTARVREALAEDPEVAELHVDVTVTAGGIYVSGEVPTPERRDAISRVLRERFGDYEAHNHTTVETVAAPGASEEIR